MDAKLECGIQATALHSNRSRTAESSSQSYVVARPPEGRNRADTRSELILVASNGLAPTSRLANTGSTALSVPPMLERQVDHLIYIACIGCQLPHALAVSWQALKRRSDIAAAMRPVSGPGVMTPCSGGVKLLGRHDGSHWVSDTRLLVPQRTIAMRSGDGVPRAAAHYCTDTRNPTSPSPLWCSRALFDSRG